MQQRIGHLLPYAMMDHCGFITARGRELRVYLRLPSQDEEMRDAGFEPARFYREDKTV
jgi:hypothetical protein